MPHRVLRLLVLLLAVRLLSGCGTGGSAAPGAPKVTITSTPSSIAVSGTEQITAVAQDSSANIIIGAPIIWATSTPSVATINAATGLVMGLLPGTTRITASANGITSTPVTLTVTPGFLQIETLVNARASTSITMLDNGMALVAAGKNSAGVLNTAELYNPATATFSLTGNLSTPRYDHSATLLDNGMVLIAGGWNTGGVVGSAELYNPSTGTFSTTGSLIAARLDHTATHLKNGQVLIAGGSNGTNTVWATVELYDPTTGIFLPAGSMNVARRLATATRLNDGTVLIAGGIDATNTALTSAEIYDPETGTFTLTGSLNTARGVHTATLLNSGMVLIAGGAQVNGLTFVPLSNAELYNPATRTFTPTGNLNVARDDASATLLNNGTVLVAGGSGLNPNPVALTSAEIYDPASGTFTPTGSLSVPHGTPAVALLPNGFVLFAGNFDLPGMKAPAELYEPGSFTPPGLESIAVAPGGMTVSPGAYQPYIATGKFASGTQQLASVTWSTLDATNAQISNDVTNTGVSVAVGSPKATVPVTITATAGNISGSATLNVRPTGFATTGNMTSARTDFTATLLNNGKVLMAGGASSANILASTELFDPTTGAFTATGGMSQARFFHTATLLNNGKVLIAGGFGAGALATAELYDPASGTFTPTGSMTTAHYYATATLLTNGKVLIAGGTDASMSYLASAELYDPTTGSFTATGSLQVGRANHTATLLGNGEVLIAGGVGSIGSVNQVLSTAELYDPVAGICTLTSSMNATRFEHTATLLSNGTVLITGGVAGTSTPPTAEVYDPSTDAFNLTGNMTANRLNHTATLLNNGKVLIAGGQNDMNPALSSAELFDPMTGAFTVANTLSTGRLSFTASRLQSGMVLFAGGGDINITPLSSAELY